MISTICFAFFSRLPEGVVLYDQGIAAQAKTPWGWYLAWTFAVLAFVFGLVAILKKR